MLVAAALVPDTALLVPGVAGAAEVLPAERAAADDALGVLLDARPDRVVVVVPARTGAAAALPADAGEPAVPRPASRPSLAAAGVPDGVLPAAGAPGPRRNPWAPGVTDHVPAAVGLLLLESAGWEGPVAVLAVEDGLAEGATLASATTDDAALGLLLVGSLSARHGPDAPLPDDPRAPDVDAALAADLTDLGDPDGPARRRLLDVPATLATELAISARGPWRALLGVAADVPLRSRAHAASAPLGAGYAVVSWRPADAP